MDRIQLDNIIKAPLSTLVGLGVGTAVAVAPVPASSDPTINIILTILQVLGSIIPVVIGALRGPK